MKNISKAVKVIKGSLLAMLGCIAIYNYEQYAKAHASEDIPEDVLNCLNERELFRNAIHTSGILPLHSCDRYRFHKFIELVPVIEAGAVKACKGVMGDENHARQIQELDARINALAAQMQEMYQECEFNGWRKN
ncbi:MULTISPECIES: hypothetical protein [unclassified Ruegeria]|uniref:hypothetical protein n=1 Tax=unclassified Ruegeria TaxID=2625375 RepID=UPI0014879B95|nr:MULTISPECIES: hypothetical protein [unclassified Ruegeria]